MTLDIASAGADTSRNFRTDIANFISIEAVRNCINAGVHERRPDRRNLYCAFVDPSGGSSDSYTIAIAHVEGTPQKRTAILDAMREVRPPFSPEAITEEFADLLKQYRVSRCVGDAYAGLWCREQFQKHGIYYEICKQTRSELYLALLPLLNSRAVDLL